MLSPSLLERVKVLLSLAPAPLSAITYTGGEALLHPDLERIVDTTAPFAVRRTIVTNGWLLTPTVIQRLKRAGLTKIRLGVDSLSKAKSRPTPGPAPKRTSGETIEMLLAADIDLELNVVITKYNHHDLDSLVELCRDHSLSAKFFERVDVSRFASSSSDGLMHSEPAVRFEAFLETARHIDPDLDHYVDPILGHANEVLSTAHYQLRYCRFLCDFGLCHATGTRIDANGAVYTCMNSRRLFHIRENQTLEGSVEALSNAVEDLCPNPMLKIG